jgi:peroxiredoxin (alkyl hydroperoxide reductase subunit C)
MIGHVDGRSENNSLEATEQVQHIAMQQGRAAGLPARPPLPHRRQELPLMLTVGDKFPAFKLTAVKAGKEGLGGPGKSFTEITESTDSGKWKIVFFWPKDFTFICPTEIAAFGKLAGEFADRDAVVYGVSTDSEFVHLNWRVYNDDIKNLEIPMLADVKRELSLALGILDKEAGVPLRATFIVDPDGTIQWASVNGLNVGRNPQEVLRVLDALQTDELCPCNWEKGKEALNPQQLFEKAA